MFIVINNIHDLNLINYTKYKEMANGLERENKLLKDDLNTKN